MDEKIKSNLNKIWHTIDFIKIEDLLKTNIKTGLLLDEVKERVKEFGQNVLPTKKKLSILKLFLSQFNNVLIYILIVSAVVSFLLKEIIDANIIILAIVVNVIVGFIQEYKAQNSLEKLSNVVESYCIVLREGNPMKILVKDVVIGDIVLLVAGNNIPADCRLFEINELEINESVLTGESIPVLKSTNLIENENEILGQRFNMAYMGTLVTRGQAKGIVVGTGLKTEMGSIASLIKNTESEKTPLQKNLAIFSKTLGYIILISCFIIFIVGIIGGRDAVEMFTIAVATAVSAIPEGLVIAVTVILAIGMQRILKKNALVRKLVSAETLGSTDVVCSDKTGTLTEGKMIVSKVISSLYDLDIKSFIKKPNNDCDFIFELGLLANNSVLENPNDLQKEWRFIGAPTEVAVLNAGIEIQKAQKKLLEKYIEIDQEPFNSIKKYIVFLRKFNNAENFIIFSGAPERVLDMSNFVFENGVEVELTQKRKTYFIDKHEKYTKQGMRLIGVGYKKVDNSILKIKSIKKDNLVFVGYFVIKDPVRKSVPQTIAIAKKAGIRTVMITGDHKNTALAIAKELGLVASEKTVLTGEDLISINDKELKKMVKKINVFARVTPKDKLRIVDAFQANGHIVAMTGDGINDAPALKSADIGIAVGSGTDVTKGVADMILLDNNFTTIILAIKEGRVIVDNIKKVIVYLLANSFSEMVLILGSLALGLPLPITATQVLWINLVTDGFPYMALTVENGEDDIMKMKPIKKNSGILDKEMKALIFIIGIVTDIVLFSLFVWHNSVIDDISHSRTIVFATLSIGTLLYVFSCKSLRKPLWKINIFDNKYLVYAVLIGIFIQIIALYTPFFRQVLRLDFLTLNDWLIILPLAFIKLMGIEIVKYIFIKKGLYSK